MTVYVGWVPTALGRLSFSRIGDWRQDRISVCNVAEPSSSGVTFGAVRRRRPQFLPGWITRMWGRYPSTYVALFLDIAPALLPYHMPEKPRFGGHCGVKLTETTDGALVGDVYYISHWGFTRGRSALQAIDFVRDSTLYARREADPAAARAWRDAAQRRVAVAWRHMRRALAAGRSTPDFGRAQVELRRSGECRIAVEIEEQPIWQWLTSTGAVGRMPADAIEELKAAVTENIAHNVFLSVRELLHKHYHHASHERSEQVVCLWTPGTDALWREHTLQGLMRMCVAYRRQDNAEAYRKALGVLAYADAFHRHLGRWSVRGQAATPLMPRVDYDFGALKASIEASLKGRELRDQTLRTRLIFAFGMVVTVLTIIIPSYRDKLKAVSEAASTPAVSVPQQGVLTAMQWAIDYPIWSLLMAFCFGFFVDQVVHFMSVKRPVKQWRSWAFGRIDALTAWMRGLKVGSRSVKVLLLIVLTTGVLGIGVIWFRVFADIRADDGALALIRALIPF